MSFLASLFGGGKSEATDDRDLKAFASEEVFKHKTADDCWLLIEGKVYDVTKYLDEHPGGSEIMVDAAGKDATEDFKDIGHSDSAKKAMAPYLIGHVG
jgi:cytochrome b involved in lipid metabolism|eukprot:CAMPEP_0174286770 /NCGR_PEP_ID=MMETSP0809-20121228/12923_1 /TAXON_ID=73025 ORGANISM="Eutreptiella gymnastica-like, Strain CCMP1594" /NCGR_SAMPLE_ID=MMETSP0809 /ASSEMBLY_ACC=CAM_ASM_000658 /LENGTH=97 /DNA_ID=CAMNT_0015382963 /DNA_START=21 /DNA_END=314 /DNA_ORIENTATION=+